MASMIFYCPHCPQVLVAENYKDTDHPTCPHCQSATLATGYTKEAWIALSSEERTAKLTSLTASAPAPAPQESPSDLPNTPIEGESIYHNIGGKIKGLAKWVVIIESIAVVIGAILFAVEDQDMLLYSLLAIIIGPLVAWVSSWLLYAFGELVEKTTANEANTRAILKLMQQNHDRNDT